jgi:hypothetical protein
MGADCGEQQVQEPNGGFASWSAPTHTRTTVCNHPYNRLICSDGMCVVLICIQAAVTTAAVHVPEQACPTGACCLLCTDLAQRRTNVSSDMSLLCPDAHAPVSSSHQHTQQLRALVGNTSP